MLLELTIDNILDLSLEREATTAEQSLKGEVMFKFMIAQAR